MKTTINKKMRVITVALLLSGLVPSTMMAQDKVEASVGADLVSGYIWRGQDLGGVSVQPSLEISYKGFSLGAWGSVGFESTDTKEFDLTLGYSIGGFSVSVTDYWFNTQVETGIDDDGETIFATNKYFKYGAHSTAHVFEAQVGYDFGPLAVNWYTNFAGADGVKVGIGPGSICTTRFRYGSLGDNFLQWLYKWVLRIRRKSRSFQGYQNHRFLLRSGICQGICQSTDRRSLLRIRIKFLRERI